MSQAVSPWDKRDTETDIAFGAFQVYRDMGWERTMVKTAEVLGKSPRYVRPLEDWSRRHEWVYRVGLWDRYCDQQAQAAYIRRIQGRRMEMQTEAERASRALMAPIIVLSERMAKKGRKGGQNLMSELQKLDAYNLVQLAAVSARALPRLHKAELLAAGEATDHLALTVLPSSQGGATHEEDGTVKVSELLATVKEYEGVFEEVAELLEDLEATGELSNGDSRPDEVLGPDGQPGPGGDQGEPLDSPQASSRSTKISTI